MAKIQENQAPKNQRHNQIQLLRQKSSGPKPPSSSQTSSRECGKVMTGGGAKNHIDSCPGPGRPRFTISEKLSLLWKISWPQGISGRGIFKILL